MSEAEQVVLEPEVEATPEPVKPKRIFLTGAAGKLGSEFMAEAKKRGWEVVAKGIDFDITSEQQMRLLSLREFGEFDWVVNCAAYTFVDDAEKNFWEAQRVNGIAPGTLSFICEKNGWRLMHISTDYVFDGEMDRPYIEGDHPRPISKYGQTKHFGEKQVMEQGADAIICRTSWLYGRSGPSLPLTMIRAWKEGKNLRVVADQQGNPTCAADLARVMGDLIELNAEKGIYHTAGPEEMTWRDLAERAIRAYATHVEGREADVQVEGIGTDEWPTAARRPKNSRLDTSKMLGLGIAPMRPVDESLAEFVKQIRLD